MFLIIELELTLWKQGWTLVAVSYLRAARFNSLPNPNPNPISLAVAIVVEGSLGANSSCLTLATFA